MESLPIDDVRCMVRLLGELPELPDDHAGRKRHLLEGISKLIDADVYLWTQVRFATDATPMAFSLVDGGYESAEQKNLVLKGATSAACDAMFNNPLAALATEHITRTRRQMTSDEVWYKSDFYLNDRQPTNLDDYLVSVYPIGQQLASGVGFHRKIGKPPFGDRERAIVHIITGEIEWLHRAGSDVAAITHLTGLSPRQRHVLFLVLEGDNRKEIAHKMTLSEHTVQDYMKDLHNHFQVSSRAELMARFISGGGPKPTSPATALLLS